MSPADLAAWRKAAGGNRFLMTVGAGVVNTALLVTGCLSEPNYLTLTLATVAVYVGAHTYQAVQELKNGPA